MIRLKTRLALFNLLSKLAFTAVFLLFMPFVTERVNLRQIDNELIKKREKVINIISGMGIEPFINSDSTDSFGSFDILKEEFISLERIKTSEDQNYIEVTTRLIEGEEIDYRVLNYTLRIDGQMYLLETGISLANIRQDRKNITRVIIVFLVFIVMITLITDLQYNRYLLSPLDKITAKLKGISDPMLFDKTTTKTNTYDFHHLDNALRELMMRIERLFQKEREITVNISHELLTPISVLRSKLENLLLKRNLDPEISAEIEDSLKTLHRLQSLVNSLLFIARIESQQYLREDSFSLREVMKEVVCEIQPIAEDASIMLNNNFNEDLRFIKANKSLVFSMFYNIVNNAVKNTPPGGTVLVKSFIGCDSRFVVSISDTGHGMNEDQLKNLFSRFKTKLNPNGTGSGIGLAIVKSIADFHNIEITVKSAVEKETVFSFIFSKIS